MADTSYMNGLNPNFIAFLHFLGKLAWILLAAFFGFVGLQLYQLGLASDAAATGKFWGIEFTVSDSGPGLIVMVVSLVCALIGAVRSKLTMDSSGVAMMHTVRHVELRPAGPEITEPYAPPKEQK